MTPTGNGKESVHSPVSVRLRSFDVGSLELDKHPYQHAIVMHAWCRCGT
jgi:hypothetical protein